MAVELVELTKGFKYEFCIRILNHFVAFNKCTFLLKIC